MSVATVLRGIVGFIDFLNAVGPAPFSDDNEKEWQEHRKAAIDAMGAAPFSPDLAVRDYDDAVSRLARFEMLPDEHTLPKRIEGVLFAVQSAVEGSEGFVLDTDRMNFIVEKLNIVRREAGLLPVRNTAAS